VATVKYNITFIPRAGSFGTQISYRTENEVMWTTPQSPANPTMLSTYPIELEENKTYYVAIASVGRNCQEKKIIRTVVTPKLTPCCPVEYTLSPDQSYCYLEQTMPPVVETENICVAPSRRTPDYTGNGTRLFRTLGSYTPQLVGQPTWLKTPYWNGSPRGAGEVAAPGEVPSPMNRLGVWIDSDCNGEKNSLRRGAILQFTVQIVLPVEKVVYIGIAGDNTFRLTVNGNIIVDCNDEPSGAADGVVQYNFTFWWVFPITLLSGPNYINLQYVGDGSTSDAAAFAMYDNTDIQIENAVSDDDLNFLFRSSDMIGKKIDIATCEPGWTLDTSGGAGNYLCKKVTFSPPVPCP
jgi:hypothetical protein